ncbi:MAG: hypothetical protein LBS05_01125 [Tannerellaceae bacterium]|jgi:DNA modification methylase|nr:hypothetical protein [Tannerellaceae bacterium]
MELKDYPEFLAMRRNLMAEKIKEFYFTLYVIRYKKSKMLLIEHQKMDFLHSGIGSAKDNFYSPVHNCYKFTTGFSYKFVDAILECETNKREPVVFDPFAGCKTTLVSSQKKGISAIGNEGQEFMLDVIKAQLNKETIICLSN